MDEDDNALIAAARAVIAQHHRPHWHTVAAALRDDRGRIWTGLHLGTTVGRLSICAEPIALGRAILEGALLEGGGKIVAAVAVRHPKPDEPEQSIAVVPPCGACRELLADYAPTAWVIVSGERKLSVAELLPLPYQR
ncbi:MAG: cytidine deaminase [Acetobacteraceae bacterium]|nr:cytidine deaminase [Acetobacteraceae bacterium]